MRLKDRFRRTSGSSADPRPAADTLEVVDHSTATDSGTPQQAPGADTDLNFPPPP